MHVFASACVVVLGFDCYVDHDASVCYLCALVLVCSLCRLTSPLSKGETRLGGLVNTVFTVNLI